MSLSTEPPARDPFHGLSGPCQRCGAVSPSKSMSFFNTDWLCEACEDRELAALQAGQPNFAGIGCPPELYLADPR